MRQKIQFLEHYLGKADIFEHSGEAAFFCVNKSCPSLVKNKKKLWIRLSDGFFHCWVCGKSGRSLRFLLKSFCSEEEIKSVHKLFKGEIRQQTFDFIPSLPQGFIPLIEMEKEDVTKPFFNYLASRRVNKDKILQFKLGVTFDDEKFKRRIIFPSFDANGFLNFCIGRSIDESAYRKYDKIDTPHGYTNSIILNELNIDFQKPLVIVEGFFDLFNAGDNTTFLACNSLSINSKLFSKIVENNTKIYLALDSDATEFQLKLANKLYRHDVSVYIVSLGQYKDPGDVSNIQFEQYLKQAKLFVEEDCLLIKARQILC